jgi:hypothetical protein
VRLLLLAEEWTSLSLPAMGAGGALFDMQQNNKQVRYWWMHGMEAFSLHNEVHRGWAAAAATTAVTIITVAAKSVAVAGELQHNCACARSR